MTSPDPSTELDRTTLPSYRLPALDQEFLLGDSMRGVRFLLEYAKAEEALRAWGVRSTVVVFGSARVRGTGRGVSLSGMRRRAPSAASRPNAAARSSRMALCATT
jgi:hypothetical protein